MALFSPKEETELVKKLLDKLNVEFSTEQIPVIVEPNAKKDNCFVNVDEKVKKEGGKTHYGWAIFQSENIIEAIRHAVWENNNEELIDITPREVEFDNIMFVSDNNFIYEGQLVDNVRINASKNLIVDDFIKVCETLEKFYTYGTRISDEAMIIPEPAKTFTFQYESLKATFLNYINKGGNPKSTCLCGSDKIYKNCHGKVILQKMEADLKETATKLSK